MSVEFEEVGQPERKIEVSLHNHAGDGVARKLRITEGTQLGALVDSYMESVGANYNANSYVRTVNRQPAASDYVLQDGDKIAVIPSEVKGQ